MNTCQASTTTAPGLLALAAASRLRHALTHLAAAGSALAGLVRQWLYRIRYRYELYELSDRQLADMGIDRWALRRETSKPFWIA